MKYIALFVMTLILSASGCREKKASTVAQPAVRVEITSCGTREVAFIVNSIDASSVSYGVGTTADEAKDLAKEEATSTTGAGVLELSWNGLEPLTDYVLCVRGNGPSGEEGKWETASFRTLEERSYVPTFSSVSLVGYWHREPRVWDAARFGPHVSWKAPGGTEQWLFEAFLFLEGSDWLHNKTFVLGSGESAGKAEWQYQLDLWLGPEGCVKELDNACQAVAGRIGAPPSKRGVIIGIPDAIMFQRFSDKNSSTTYWGDGLDFASVEDRLKALRWYIDSARRMFSTLGCKYLELSGFYITSEEIYLPWDIDVNCRYKNWDVIAPALADYCHDAQEGLYWIPYHMGPGYKYWKQLGIDQVWMQPNWYWDLRNEGRHPFSKTISAIKEADMSGMELEFEYSCVTSQMTGGTMGPDGAGNLVFTADDVPALKDRVRQYMKEFRDAGFYGVKSIALYSGTNAFTQLATSPDAADRALYDEVCQFIIGGSGNRKMQAAH